MIRVLVVEDQKIMQKYFEYILCRIRNFDMFRQSPMRWRRSESAVILPSILFLMDVQTFHNHDGLKAGKAIREASIYEDSDRDITD